MRQQNAERLTEEFRAVYIIFFKQKQRLWDDAEKENDAN